MIKVFDLTAGGTADNFYRLSVGGFAYVTGTFPLAISADAESKVQLLGHNLPADASVKVKAGAAGEMDVPVDPAKFRSRRLLDRTSSWSSCLAATCGRWCSATA